jgi:hypothetical protein
MNDTRRAANHRRARTLSFPKTGKQRQLWCLAISAKRYVLFLRDGNGEPTLLRKGINNGEDGWSQHGLGHLLNPSDPTSEDRSWIAQAWLGIVRRSLGLATEPLPFADRVALGQTTVSSPEVLRPLAKLNAGKPHAQQIKPFNFILSCHVAPYGIRPMPIPSAFTSSPRMKLTRASGSRCRGSISIQASSIGSVQRSRLARSKSRASRATATCCKSMSSTKRPSVWKS